MKQTAWTPLNYAGAWGPGHWLASFSSRLFSAAGGRTVIGLWEPAGSRGLQGCRLRGAAGGGGAAPLPLPPSHIRSGGAEPHSPAPRGRDSRRSKPRVLRGPPSLTLLLPPSLTKVASAGLRPSSPARTWEPLATVPQLCLPLPLLSCQRASRRGNSKTGT